MFQDETCQRRRPRGYRKKMNLSPYPTSSAFYQLPNSGTSYEISEMTDLPHNSYPYAHHQYEYPTPPTSVQFEGWNYVDQYPKISTAPHSPMQDGNNSPINHPHMAQSHHYHHHHHHAPPPPPPPGHAAIDYGYSYTSGAVPPNNYGQTTGGVVESS